MDIPPRHPTPLLVVVGPTAAGKSTLALALAQRLNGEVVGADSQQVYRYFDIGTGKLSATEQMGIAHHLIDVIDPDQPFSAAHFVELADQAIAQITHRGRQVIVAGGTGLYVKTLIHGLFAAPPADQQIRTKHREIRDQRGISVLRKRLETIDPQAAQRIDQNDFIRISRALEVFEQTGLTISALQQEHRFAPQRYPALLIGIAPQREQLRQHIDRRVDEMLARGWLDEVRQLLADGYSATRPMKALGYRQLHAHLAAGLDFCEAVRQTKRDTWRFARRQLSWFSTMEKIVWQANPAEPDWKQIAAFLDAWSEQKY